MVDFVSLPNRDAFATQRGYLYQALLSVKAWAELTESEILELETGEDIDWVHLADSSSRLEADRVLGQVKFRKKRLSLRSPEALESIVNYWSHISRNPSLHLHFRFISNAETTWERGKKYRLQIPGIDLWSSLSLPLPGDEQRERLAHIRCLLALATKPASTDILTWDAFRRFIEASTEQELLTFANGFKWMMRSTDLEEAIESVLLVIAGRPELKGHPSAVSYCLNFLLFQVLQTLSQPKTKALTASQCSLALTNSIGEALSAAHSDLNSIFSKISQSADSFEVLVCSLKRVTDVALSKVEEAQEYLASRTELSYEAPRPLFQAPTPIQRVASRTQLVSTALEKLGALKCLYAVGDVGIGKTTLSQLIASHFDQVFWARLRVNPGIEPSAILDTIFHSSRADKAQNGPHEYANTIATIDRRSLLVVEDFDVAATRESFVERLKLVAYAVSGSQLSVLVTSNTEPPASLAPSVARLHIDGYCDDDVAELLRLYGCPDALNQEGFRALVLGTTGRHPLLTSALLRFLEECSWRLTDDTVNSLMSKSFAADVRKEMQRRLVTSEDEQTRELLYRLSLIDFNFTEQQAIEVASISPEIPRATERLNSLSGIWLQRVSRELFVISPLIFQEGGANLTTDVRRRVHSRLARWILGRKKLDQVQTISAITHLTASGQHSLAGVVFLQVLQAALTLESISAESVVLSIWSDLALPLRMNLGIKIMIRGLQVALFAHGGRDVNFVQEDLASLVSEAAEDIDRFAVVAACGYAAIYLIQARPLLALKFCATMLANEPLLDPEMRAQLATDHEVSELLWLIGPQLKSAAEIAVWISIVARLNSQQCTTFENSEFACDAGWAMFQQLWVAEQKKEESKRAWPGLMSQLEQWEVQARSMQLEFLAACIFRAQQAIRIVHLHQVEDGIVRAKATIEKLPPDSAATFVISSGTGLWLTDAGSSAEVTAEWLEIASQYRGDAIPYLQMANELQLAEALYGVGRSPKDAFDRALEIASGADALSDVDRAVAQSERAIWLWKDGQRLESLEASEEALAILLSQATHSQKWKQTFVLLGNNISYYRAIADGESTGNNLTVPFLGMFHKDLNDLSALYSDGTQWIVPATLSWLAVALEQFEKAGDWALRTVEIADEVSADPNGRFLLIDAVPNRLKVRDFDTAIDYARNSALVTTQHHPFKVSDEMRANNPQLFNERHGQVPPVSAAEKWAVITGVFPAFLDIVALSLTDENQAYSAAVSLTQKCSQVAIKSQHSELWQAANLAITRSIIGEVDWDKEIIVDPSGYDDAAQLSLLFISFGSGFANRRMPKDVFVAQIRWAGWLGTYFGKRKRGIAAFIAKALGEFWLSALSKGRFYFRAPAETQRRLEKAIEQRSEQEVFLVVADGLGLVLPDDLRKSLTRIPDRAVQ